MEELYGISPFCLNQEEKKKMLLPKYQRLTGYHYVHCESYRRILDCIGWDNKCHELSEIPFIPVRLFKEYDLFSVPKESIVKTVASSGTSGQVSSKIFLDKYTSLWQQKVLTNIVGDFIGKSRMPMLILDCPDVVKNRHMFSTRGAGILGFSTFGTKRVYALKNDMTLDYEAVDQFMDYYGKQQFLMFGFTFIIWKHVLLELEKGYRQYDFSKGAMIHGGGWKKLKNEAVSKEEFRQRFKKVCGLKKIHENYGMAEQTGSIFVECECGHLHASNYSEVIVRKPDNFQPCMIGEKGILQVMSVIPHSYPGHSLLTEDEGVIIGEDDCQCGRKGKYFKILGRIANAELRGCSDTYAAGIKK